MHFRVAYCSIGLFKDLENVFRLRLARVVEHRAVQHGVLGHVLETSRLAPADLVTRTRSQVRGAGVSLWTQAACLVAGIVLAIVVAPTVGPWLAGGGIGG